MITTDEAKFLEDGLKSTGADTQQRFHYQAQYGALLALDVLYRRRLAAMYCELHSDFLLKHYDHTYTAHEVKTRESGGRPFSATEADIMAAIRNFVALQRRYKNLKQFTLATNYAFKRSNDHNDLQLLKQQACNCNGIPENDTALHKFVSKFQNRYSGFIESEVISTLAKIDLIENLPHFDHMSDYLISRLRAFQLAEADDQCLLQIANSLTNKVKDASRQYDSSQLNAAENIIGRADLLYKKLTPQIVESTIQLAITKPLGSVFKAVAIPTAPSECFETISHVVRATSSSFQGIGRKLSDDQVLVRPETELLLNLIREGKQPATLITGEPGSGKSALMADLHDQLSKENKFVFCIKCDELPTHINDQLKLTEWFELPYLTASCLKMLAQEQPVVVLIDQIDALGSLMDSGTSRIQIVLNLVHQLQTISNIQIVISCREFDSQYDVRLSKLRSNVLNLSLPPLERVEDILKKHGISITNWPEDTRQVLRVPQHLDIFLKIVNDDPSQNYVFKNYIDMVAKLWDKKVKSKHEPLLKAICDAISDRKQSFIPVSTLPGSRENIDELVSAGVLKYNNNEQNLGFAHQTLYEYCRARQFTKGEQSFSKYVNDNQNVLFIRPEVWNCLHHLRDCDQANYMKELSILWKSDLRPHMRWLIIDFLGQLKSPLPAEAALLLPVLNEPQFNLRTVQSIRDNAAWFEYLKHGFLPIAMVDPDKAWICRNLLFGAAKFDQNTVINLIKTYWLNDPINDTNVLYIFKNVKSWDAELCKIVAEIINRSHSEGVLVDMIATDAAESAPEGAVLILQALLEIEIKKAINMPKMDYEFKSSMDEKTIFETHFAHASDSRTKAFSQIVDDHNRRYFLPKIAEGAPKSFLLVLWPTILSILKELEQKIPEIRKLYHTNFAHLTSLPAEVMSKSETLYALLANVMKSTITFAKSYAEEFLNFVHDNQGSECLFVHRLLCLGLCQIAADYPDAALNYLLEDDRRLLVGDVYDNHAESKALIKALFPALSPQQRLQLEQHILKWQLYKDINSFEKELKEQKLEWQRQHRIRLLRAIPSELLSVPTKEFLTHEEEELGHTLNFDMEYPDDNLLPLVKSPMSMQQMSDSSADDVISLFEELPDNTKTNPRDWQKGGVYEASREVGQLAVSDPEKAISLLNGLQPGRNEIPVANILEGLAQSTITADKLQDIIIELVGRGFNSVYFYSYAARALDTKLRPGFLIKEELRKLFEYSLALIEDDKSKPLGEYRKDRKGSILWPSSSFQTIPTEGLYPIVRLLTAVCFAEKEPDYTRWLEMIRRQLKLKDHTAWQALSLTEIARIRQCDYEQARNFLAELFLKQEHLLNSHSGIILLSSVLDILSQEQLQLLLNQLPRSSFGNQAKGELLTLLHFLYGYPWSKQLIDHLVSDIAANLDCIIGMAYATGKAWQDMHYRKRAGDFCKRLLSLDILEVTNALAISMRVDRFMPPDELSYWLIETLCSKPKLFRSHFHRIAESLSQLLVWNPEIVYSALSIIIGELAEELGDHSKTYILIGTALIDLVMSLQRISGFEVRSLELFELLIKLDVHPVKDRLNEIDRIPTMR